MELWILASQLEGEASSDDIKHETVKRAST